MPLCEDLSSVNYLNKCLTSTNESYHALKRWH